MDYIHSDLGYRHRGEIVRVTLSGSAANVLLLDGSNYSAFRNGRQHRYHGGLANRSPVDLVIPRDGHWYAVVHMGGLGGRVKAGFQVLPGALPPIRQSAPTSLSAIRQAVETFTNAEADAGPAGEKSYG